MASSEQIKALLQSYADSDGERFISIALQMAAHEARSGHGRLAQELREIIDRARKKSSQNIPVSIAAGVKDTNGLLSISHPRHRLADLIAPEELHKKLERVVHEQRQMSKLKNHGLSPRRHLLLVGPPGTGKTFTASILAGELDYPLFQVRLDALITKFMGESSAKLRQVFDAIRDVRGVYFFDEFDALGSQRNTHNDVGEARRILNSFLQMIEQDDSSSLIVCATNHVGILDPALFRRFDDVIQYELPTSTQIEILLRNKLKAYVGKNFPWKKVANDSIGLSGAEITWAAEDSIKEILIKDQEKISAENIMRSIDERRNMNKSIAYQ